MHVLQRLARETAKNDIQPPPQADYDFAGGVWRQNGEVIALNPELQPATKKEDIETGEDVKGT